MVVVLHNIRSSHNVGSIFRTADAAGIGKIYLAGITPSPIDKYGRPNTRLTKVSLGAENFVVWEKVKSTARLIDKLKAQGYNILAVEQSDKSEPLFKVKLTKTSARKSVLVLGNEITGLPPGLLKRADTIVEIPMAGKKESLNVAVAFGIAAFHLCQSAVKSSAS